MLNRYEVLQFVLEEELHFRLIPACVFTVQGVVPKLYPHIVVHRMQLGCSPCTYIIMYFFAHLDMQSQIRFLYIKLYVVKLGPALDPAPTPPGGKRGGGPMKNNV